MSNIDVWEKIEKLKETGKIFSVFFIKRTNNEERLMLCRGGVTKHLTHGERRYQFEQKGLINVFDMQKVAYRTIPVDNIIKINGQYV